MTFTRSSSKDIAKAPRCPNCGKRGAVKVLDTRRDPEGRTRERICKLCNYVFTTQMKLPERCPHCDALDNYGVARTKNLYTGVLRAYRCGGCKKCIPSFEPFPVPDDKRKRPDSYYFQ